jgi:cobalt-zinc-cadmium efflux system protein
MHNHHHHGHAHGHHHHHGHSHSNQKNILLAFGLNASFAVIEFVGGYLTNSVAIYSDALHDLGDSLALLFAYFAEKLSLKKADNQYTFGYRRFSVLAALINGLILLVGSVFIISEAIQRFQNPEPIHAPGVLGLAFLGIAVNGFAAYRMSKNSGMNSQMIKLHLLEDILGWCAVLVVSIVLLFKPWYFLDSVLSVLIAFMIISGVIRNLRNVTKIFLQAFPDTLNREDLIKDLMKIKHVVDVHFLQGWSVDESSFNLTLHVKVDSELRMKEVDSLRVEIQAYLKNKHVVYSTIQFEGTDCC